MFFSSFAVIYCPFKMLEMLEGVAVVEFRLGVWGCLLVGVFAEYGLGSGVVVMLVKSFVGVGMLVVSVETPVL